jgi:transposase, IS5 family
MPALAILKHTYNLSDEAACERWVESPYHQLFRGEEFFRHDLPFDRSSIAQWRQRVVEGKIAILISESLNVPTRGRRGRRRRRSPRRDGRGRARNL